MRKDIIGFVAIVWASLVGVGASAQQPVDLSDLRINMPPERPAVAVGTKRAMIVGVGEAEYDGIKQHPLPTCRLDAQAMARVLGGLGYECTVLTDSEGSLLKPTKENFGNVFNAFVASAEPEDTLFVYMSSHGGMIDGAPHVVLMDGAASVPEMKTALGASKALVRVVMLDCCRSEGEIKPDVSETRDVYTLSACAPDQISQVGVNGLSIFTEAFIDGMTDCNADRLRDGVIELDEIVYYMANEVPRRADAQRHAEQSPTRTVVDPRSINPVMGVCDLSLSKMPRRTTALGGPRANLARKDWILQSLMLPKVSTGMTAEAVLKAMEGKGSILPPLDAEGNGPMLFPDEPKVGDSLLVTFEKGAVTGVSTSVGGMCETPYDAKASREAALKIIDGGNAGKLTFAVENKTIAEVVALLGCPTASLVSTDGIGNGSLRYIDVPRVTQMLVVTIERGRATGTEIRILGE